VRHVFDKHIPIVIVIALDAILGSLWGTVGVMPFFR